MAAPGGRAGEAALDWSEVYERLVRYPERRDAAAWAELQRRVGAWAAMRGAGLHREVAPEVVAETCAEVWRTLQLARGGAGFEGFVQGRFVETVRRLTAVEADSGPDEADPEPGDADSGPDDAAALAAQLAARGARLQKALEELRKRNPLHHRAVALVYLDEATVGEAADALAVDVWTLRTVLARARQALAEGVDRAERVREARRAGQAPAGGQSGKLTGRGKPRRAGAGRGQGGPGGKPGGGGGRTGGPGGPGPKRGKGRPPGGGRPG